MKAGIVIDAWKLPIFEKYLTEGGFTFENKGHFTPDTLTLTVQTEDIAALHKVIAAANRACTKEKPTRWKSR